MFVSIIRLSDDVEVELNAIEGVVLNKKDSRIDQRIVTVASGAMEPLTVAQDVLIVRLNDGGEVAVRGEQKAKNAWDVLDTCRKEQRLAFEMSLNDKR